MKLIMKKNILILTIILHSMTLIVLPEKVQLRMPKRILLVNWKEQEEITIKSHIKTEIAKMSLTKVRKKTERKKRNKSIHSLNGNRKKSSIKIAFWNDKLSQSHKARSTRDNVSLILKEKDIDIICISEANIMKDDEPSEININGFDLLTDNLLQGFGRARSAMYIKNNLKYKMRKDLMNKNEPEVWIEVKGSKREAPLLITQYYREHSQV